MGESMTKDEISRYLLQQLKDGKTELEALRNLLDLLNVSNPYTNK